MKKFLINVNGNQYEVEVEEVTNSTAGTQSTVKTQPTTSKVEKPAPQPVEEKEAEQPKEKKKVEVSAGSETVKAPMPGTILDIRVKEGESVKKNQVVVILEAMKMENEIVSPRDGVVSAIVASKGESVNTGDDMVVLE